jgi:hypothetical protein
LTNKTTITTIAKVSTTTTTTIRPTTTAKLTIVVVCSLCFDDLCLYSLCVACGKIDEGRDQDATFMNTFCTYCSSSGLLCLNHSRLQPLLRHIMSTASNFIMFGTMNGTSILGPQIPPLPQTPLPMPEQRGPFRDGTSIVSNARAARASSRWYFYSMQN